MNLKILLLAAATLTAQLPADATEGTNRVHFRTVDVGGTSVFYREAGPKDAPTVLLLHGFGASSHMFRELIPALAARYHIVAPDLPGFGQTIVKQEPAFTYTFDNVAEIIDQFTIKKGLDRYALYVFDYGAPIGWRLAVANPEKVTAIVSQNGNAYEEGLSDGWIDIRKAWASPTPESREALRKFNTLEMIKWQYTEGVKDTSMIAPESYQLAYAAIERNGVEPQVDLLLDYGSNVRQYEKLHAFFRQNRPPTLAIWGRNDPFFLPAGAEAFKRDNPDAEVHLLDTGHFAIETHGEEISKRMLDFLDRKIKR